MCTGAARICRKYFSALHQSLITHIYLMTPLTNWSLVHHIVETWWGRGLTILNFGSNCHFKNPQNVCHSSRSHTHSFIWFSYRILWYNHLPWCDDGNLGHLVMWKWNCHCPLCIQNVNALIGNNEGSWLLLHANGHSIKHWKLRLLNQLNIIWNFNVNSRSFNIPAIQPRVQTVGDGFCNVQIPVNSVHGPACWINLMTLLMDRPGSGWKRTLRVVQDVQQCLAARSRGVHIPCVIS